MKYCRYCGYEMKDNDIICFKCFREQNTSDENKTIDTYYDTNHSVEEYHLTGWWLGFLLGWIGVIIIYLVNTGKPERYRRPYFGAVLWSIFATLMQIVSFYLRFPLVANS